MNVNEVVEHFRISPDMLTDRAYTVKHIDWASHEIEVPPYMFSIEGIFDAPDIITHVRKTKIEILAIAAEGQAEVTITDPNGLLSEGV